MRLVQAGAAFKGPVGDISKESIGMKWKIHLYVFSEMIH